MCGQQPRAHRLENYDGQQSMAGKTNAHDAAGLERHAGPCERGPTKDMGVVEDHLLLEKKKQKKRKPHNLRPFFILLQISTTFLLWVQITLQPGLISVVGPNHSKLS
jgi:hypothetical protein